MDKRKLEELIRLVEDSDIDELELSGPLRSIRIVKARRAPAERQVVSLEAIESERAAQPLPTPAAEPAEGATEADAGLARIVSPMVGTFYAAPAPEAPPYVRQGDHVSRGQVVCIVEAMKLMNEIESDVAGTIVRVCVENAQPVEYGQVLFLVQPD